MAAGGVRGLAFVLYVYEDHGIVAVTRRDYLPLAGTDRRICSFRVAVGRTALSGLSPRSAVRLVAAGILAAVSDPSSTLPGPQDPGAPMGATGVAGQLRVDLPD